jgi:tRNA(Ile)-lysidine synthase
MLDSATGVLVAVSGGPDSVVVLDMLLRVASGTGGWPSGAADEQEARSSSAAPHADPQPPSPIPHLHVAHLDHMLRGESDEDAEFVRALAERLGLQVTISVADVRAGAVAAGRGIEETAREIRYDFLLSAAKKTGCDRIAVGHTMTDQAETFVMRLIRGAGSRGLAAMRPVSTVPSGRRSDGETGRGGEVSPSPRLPVAPFPFLIRPLLCITREEVEAYCRERKLEFRTDVTNRDLHYTRNRIRCEIIPAMRAINPRVVETIARAVENLAGDQDALDSLSSSLLKEARVERAHDRWHKDDGSAAYSVTTLLKQPAGMRRRMIIEALRFARDARDADLAAGEISSIHIRAVESLLNPASSGKRVTLPGGLDVWREFGALVLKRSGVEPANYRIAISASDIEVQAAGFDFAMQRDLPGALLRSIIHTAQREKTRTGFDWMEVALMDCALPDCLIIRSRQSGERAHVVGQRRTKKLKNLMIDHRIPSSRRVNWPLVTTPDGRYVWSPGLPPAVEFAARDESQRLAILRASAI